ncbi:hypothetical protein L1887_63198 [Cichorium endivia]|nr:hypothetical protein L1887_63198 [Cichorium endivia]
MPVAAVGLLVVLSVESFKASSRFFQRRKSKKHGYSSLRTDSLGRPISEDGKRLSKNEAKALVAHNREIQRIRTAEREWRAKGERLPAYAEMDDDAIIQSLRRPSTAPASGRSSSSPSVLTVAAASPTEGVGAGPVRPRAVSTTSAGLETPASGVRAQREARSDDLAVSTFESLDGGAFFDPPKKNADTGAPHHPQLRIARDRRHLSARRSRLETHHLGSSSDLRPSARLVPLFLASPLVLNCASPLTTLSPPCTDVTLHRLSDTRHRSTISHHSLSVSAARY